MRNNLLLISYLALFVLLVSNYNSYRENTLVVVLVAAVLLITGLLAWVASIQGPREN